MHTVSRFAASAHAALLLLFALFAPVTAHATTLNVPTQYATIQAGVDAAHEGDTVLVADGTYSGDGNRDIDFMGKNITVTSVSGAVSTIVDCQDDSGSPHRGFYVHRSETSAVLRGFTIKNGNTATVSGVADSGLGGGICIDNATATVQNCTLTNNGSESGGSLYCASSDPNVRITINACTVSGYGIGVVNVSQYGGGPITLNNCTVSDCPAQGVSNSTNYDGGLIALNFCTVSGNGYQGVANYNTSGGTISLNGCTISGNTSPYGFGGGVSNNNAFGGAITLNACAISGNTSLGGSNAAFGGGVYNYNFSNGTIAFSNCTISGNTASAKGGGVYNFNSTGFGAFVGCSIALTNCTVTGNTCYGFGGIYNAVNDSNSAILLTNSIVYGNSGGEVVSGNINPPLVSYSDVLGGFAGTGNINAGPLFVNAANGDLHLRSGSPCIRIGTANGAPLADKEGVTRPNPPSIGAYEYVAPASTHTFTATHIAAEGGGSNVLLWNGANGAAFVQTVQANGTATKTQTFGPYTGASAKAVAVAPDGSLRLLWTNTNGSAAVWSLSAAGTVTSYGTSFGPYTGSTATGMTVTADGKTRLLWTTTAGAATVWTLDAIGRATAYGPTFGPYTGGAHVSAIGGGADGRIRLLWTNSTNAASVWLLDSTAHVVSYGQTYGPYTGAATLAVSGGADGKTRLLWKNSTNAASVWTLSSTGAVLSYGTTYGPYTGASAFDLSVGADNVTRLLWTNSAGQASVWSVSPTNGAVTYSPSLGPF